MTRAHDWTREDTYFTYVRGVDSLWGMYQWIDRAPKVKQRHEMGIWWRHHDEYDKR